MTDHLDSTDNAAPPLGLTWGIKRSFVRYVSFLPDVSVSIANGAEATNGSFFTFAPNGGELDPHTGFGTLHFKGEVHMSGHGGMMQLRIVDPWITLTPHGASLGMPTPALEPSSTSGSAGIVLATLNLPSPERDETGMLWQDVPTSWRPTAQRFSMTNTRSDRKWTRSSSTSRTARPPDPGSAPPPGRHPDTDSRGPRRDLPPHAGQSRPASKGGKPPTCRMRADKLARAKSNHLWRKPTPARSS